MSNSGLNTRVIFVFLLVVSFLYHPVRAIRHGLSLPFRRRNNLNEVPTRTSSRHFLAKKTVENDTSYKLNAAEVCLCGAFATVFGDFCLHPIDTIKVTQQAAGTALSFFGAVKQIFTSQGPLGFYQGVVPYLVGDGASGAVKFAAFETSKKYLESRIPTKYHPAIQFVCGAGAMFACSVILVPGEVLKCKIQAGLATSLGSALSKTLSAEGLRGLYAGYCATLLRDVPYTMLELGVYENIKAMTRNFRRRESITSGEEAAAAAFTGAVAAFLTTPLDLIKTKLMLQGSSGGPYNGVVDAIETIYRHSGLEGLFVGSTARVVWLVPFTVVYLGVYEASKRKLLVTRAVRPTTNATTSATTAP